MNIFWNINTYLAQESAPLTAHNYNEVDALIFAELTYYPFEQLYETDKSIRISLQEFSSHLLKELKQINQYSKDKQMYLQELSHSKRYAGCMIHSMKFINTAETRWAALTIDIVSGNYSVIAMRGTDKTTVGWNENFRLGYSVMGTGAQLASFRYLKESDARNIYLTGHSKGGSNVCSAFVMSSQDIRDKIKRIDNFDGPGMNPEFVLNYSDGYQELAGKLNNFYPQDSIIGLLLKDNPGKPSFIKTEVRADYANALIFGQHDPFAWEVKDRHFVRTYQTCLSVHINRAADELVAMTTGEQRYHLIQGMERIGIPAIISGEIQGITAALTTIVSGLVHTTREEREAIFYALMAFIKSLIGQSKEWIAKKCAREYNVKDSSQYRIELQEER